MKKHIKWLYSQLPDLVKTGVLTAEAEQKLRAHYGEEDKGAGVRIAITVCSILGSVLIGSGIILLLAHNWSELSRTVRTVLAIAPLLVSQLLAVWIIYTDRRSAAWREGVGVFLTLAVGASISLIAQTYHIPGDLGNFLFVWSLLALPLIYLLGSSLTAVIYLVGITFWSGYEQNSSRHAAYFWPLFALAVPHLWLSAKKDAYSARSTWLLWALAFCLCVGLGIALEKTLPGLWVIAYGSLFGLLYLAGNEWFGEAEGIFKKPLHTVGAAGIGVLSFLYTYDWVWDDIGWCYYRRYSRYHEWAAVPDYIITTVFLVAAIVMIVRCMRKGKKHELLLGVFPLMSACGYFLVAGLRTEHIGLLLFNAYMLVLGIGMIIYGIKAMRMGSVNCGMFVLAVLIVARFFDSDMGFIGRGIVFIVLGTGFLVSNLIMAKRFKRKEAS